ncbi:tripartite motif-containing protein 10 [Scaptodrosophila lebanonensis]|uniref:Tripartite motif-containing protein 10 n=1 Tax=Drosophila lebanonensis TaxID=7225 RepID=A0A6J2T7R3_DROLE|nr:tripartite motif-containing protein 10 [Scaptodrosophila lebanonensis]
MSSNTCIFCLDEQRSPHWIPCGHSFCTECFQRFLQLSADYRCPLCRSEFQPNLIEENCTLLLTDINIETDTLVLNLTEEEFRLFEEMFREVQCERERRAEAMATITGTGAGSGGATGATTTTTTTTTDGFATRLYSLG